MPNPNLQLKVARITAGKTQLDVALAIETNQCRISLFERGLAGPSAAEAARIVEVLSDRKGHCESLRSLLVEKGITSHILTGDLSNGERKENAEAWRFFQRAAV